MENEYEKKEMEDREKIATAEKLLAAAGFKLQVGGCGCCASPWMKLEHNGVLILDNDGYGMDMFTKKE